MRTSPNIARDVLSQTSRWRTVACLLLLLLINAYIILRLFTCEYIPSMGSIEGAYIGLSRYILKHPFELTWFSLWYGGIPFVNTYPPLMHVVVAVAAWLGDVSPARAHHIVMGVAYCIGPLSLFWLALCLTGDRLSSFVAGLFYSVVSPATFLMPSVWTSLGTAWGPHRLHALVEWGEGPHVLSMAFLPIAIVALHHAVLKPRALQIYLAALAVASVPMTNWLGAFALATSVLAYLLAYHDHGKPFRVPLTAAGVGIVAYALVSPWIPPTNIADIARNSQRVGQSYPLGPKQLLYAIALALLVVLTSSILRKKGVEPPLRFSLLFFELIGSIPLIAEWTGFYLVPQPERYQLEMEMALALVVAIVGTALVRRLPKKAVLAVAGACLLIVVRQVTIYRHDARGMVQPFDIKGTLEYRVARWLDGNLPGQRIFATGSTRFWLNAFANNPQLGGGFDQGMPNQEIRDALFAIPYRVGDGNKSANLLRAYGVSAIVVSGPNTRNAYQDYRDPNKFAAVLPELWRDGDDVIYAVPRRSNSLAQVIRAEHVITGLATGDRITTYVNACENPELPIADLRWLGPQEAALQADLNREDLVSVQITHRSGWHATLEGQPVQIRRDGLGFMVLAPDCSGTCNIRLFYDGGVEAALSRIACGLALVWGAVWFWWDHRKGSRHTDEAPGAGAALRK